LMAGRVVTSVIVLYPCESVPGAKDQRNGSMLTLPRQGIKMWRAKGEPFTDSLPILAARSPAFR